MRRRKRVGFGQVAGEDHPAARLTVEAVVALRRRVRAEPGAFMAIVNETASAFRLSPTAVYYAATGQTWKSVDRRARPYRLTIEQRRANLRGAELRTRASRRRRYRLAMARGILRAMEAPELAIAAYG